MRLTLIAVCLALAAGSTSHAVASEQDRPDATTQHGFRYDPMQFVRNGTSLQAALVRRNVFHDPLPGDDEILQQRIEEILAEQNEDGSLSQDPSASAERLIELVELGADVSGVEVKRAAETLLREASEDNQGQPSVRGTRALCLVGLGDRPEVKAALTAMLGRRERLLDPWWLCPWGHSLYAAALWEGRTAAATQGLVVELLASWDEALNEACLVTNKDPWGIIGAAGLVDLPQAGRLVARHVPIILRGQQEDGGWGEHSLAVFRALVTHGLLEPLRKLPPLPSDWRVVRAFPAPDGKLFSLAYGGERLWALDQGRKEAVALSPEDGRVMKRLPIPLDHPLVLGWWDGGLAVAQQEEPKRLVKLDLETGRIVREISLAKVTWPWGFAEVDGELWFHEAWEGMDIRLDPDRPEEPKYQPVAGPGLHLAATPDGIWQAHDFGPVMVKNSTEGKLLDWAEQPFDGRCDGIAFDGEHLWALDARSHRIRALEKAAGKEQHMPATSSAEEGGSTQSRVLLDSVVADFRRITNDLECHQVVVGDIIYPQPAVYLTTHLVEMWAAGWTDADFDTLAAVSGASALFGYQPEDFMPKYANLHIGMDDRIAGATGFGYEWVPFEDTDSAWPIIKETIDSGTPLKGWHWENLLIGGYQDAAQEQDRKVFVMNDGPGTTAEWWTWQRFTEWTAEWPHFLGRHTERVERAPAKGIALRVMRDLAEWSADPPDAVAREYPEAKFGLEGIEAYAADCADMETYDDWLACHPINPQWTVRNSTAVYLKQVAEAGLFSPQVTEQISAAAREYRAAYEDWQEFYNQLGHDAPESAGKTKERRLAGAAAIRSALEHERAAIGFVRDALALAE